MQRPLLLAIFLIVFFNDCLAFGFGLGGGGGCQSQCGGGCGRKKREIIEPQVRTELTDFCPQNEWRSTMIENIGKNIETSKYAIQGALSRKYDAKFFVVCQPKAAHEHIQFVANGEGYCIYGNDHVTCSAVALVG